VDGLAQAANPRKSIGSDAQERQKSGAADDGARGQLRRGDLMGLGARGGQIGRVARVGAVVLGCAALANCSASKVLSDRYSERVVAEGEPVPKGGGGYKVGQPYTINGKTYYPSESPAYRGEGIASWYGPDFHGRLTANGEVFDMHGISAAHPTMPIPSYARVTNLDNGRSIIVRVNDRGPYARNRIIDVSIGAANALGFYGDGLAHVRVEYVGRAPLQGSDDRVLLATLREGRPAQVPAQLMIASTQPLVPSLDEGDDTPLPPERPFALGGESGRLAARSGSFNIAVASAAPERSVVKLPAARAQRGLDPDPALRPDISPLATFAPVRDGGALGLMSGRGLY
jgi:rare lipoprotein A